MWPTCCPHSLHTTDRGGRGRDDDDNDDDNDDEGPPPANRRRALEGAWEPTRRNSALTGLEPGIFPVDHEDLAVTTDNLGARLVLQRPKGLADLHLALLRLSGGHEGRRLVWG